MGDLFVSEAPRLPVRSSIRDQVVASLRAAILGGELEVGITYSAPLLAQRFGVSATPVREAMLDLIGDGLVSVMPNKGFRIAETSLEDLNELVKIRELLEIPTVGAIAKSVTPDQVMELRDLASSLDAAIRRGRNAEIIEQDRQFHMAVFRLCGNGRLVELLERLRVQAHMAALAFARSEAMWKQSSEEHDELLNAFQAHDAKAAQAITSRHIRRAIQGEALRGRSSNS